MADQTIPPLVHIDDLFDKDMFTLLGLENISKEQRDRMTTAMMQTIEAHIFARVMDKLSSEQLVEFEAVIDKHEPDAVQEFLRVHEIDLIQIAAEETLLYKAEVLSLAVEGNGFPMSAVAA